MIRLIVIYNIKYNNDVIELQKNIIGQFYYLIKHVRSSTLITNYFVSVFNVLLSNK